MKITAEYSMEVTAVYPASGTQVQRNQNGSTHKRNASQSRSPLLLGICSEICPDLGARIHLGTSPEFLRTSFLHIHPAEKKMVKYDKITPEKMTGRPEFVRGIEDVR